MSEISYSNLEVLFENEKSRVQKGLLNGQYYILKNYKLNAFRDLNEKIQKEVAVTNQLFDLESKYFENDGLPTLVKPFIEGLTLSEFIKNWNFSEHRFIGIAVELTKKLSEIHQKGFLHLDLNPSNIIYNPVDRSVHIIDFGSAHHYRHKSMYLGNPERVDCDLHYISPEQTGRNNGIIDFSSDLYALGTIMYELATGRRVFESKKALELVHSHLAKIPENPTRLNRNLSFQVAKIILKLLSKNPEDRYQSDHGLLHDLEKCQSLLKSSPYVKEFPLGEHDINEKFRISQKAYGRDKEIYELENAYQEVCLGKKRYALVSGTSGTGKTRVINETHKQLAKTNGTFIKGKFDQVHRDLPYYAWKQAFNNFFELIITESDETIERWKKHLEEELGENLPYLSQIVPNLNWLFPGMEKSGLAFKAESQNLFKYAIRSFITALASPDKPLIIFIDDWQWADKASVDLLRNLLYSENGSNILFIGAYRNNEIRDDHHFNEIIEISKRDNYALNIHLENLTLQDTHQLITDTLKSNEVSVSDLNQLIYDRTEGNAHYYTQFLTALHDENLIKFDHELRKWVWDKSHINRAIPSDNIVELLVRKVERFEENELQILKKAACIGGKFDVEILSLVSGLAVKDIEDNLDRALSEGLIYTDTNLDLYKKGVDLVKKEFRFAHDRIQQGIYALINENEKVHAHHDIGKFLLDRWEEQKIGQNIFSIIEHLNKGANASSELEHKKHIAVSNLKASQKAQNLVDFENALKYASQGIEVLENWRDIDAKDLMLQLHLQRYQIGNLVDSENIEKWEEEIFAINPSPYEQAALVRIKINSQMARGDLKSALEIGLKFLDQQGYKINIDPTQQDVINAAIKTAAVYDHEKIEELIELDIIDDPFILELTEIFQAVNASAYFYNQTLWALITIETTHFYLTTGLSPLAALTFLSYGAILILSNNDFSGGVGFGKLALAIFEKANTSYQLNKSLFSYYGLISWWESHIEESIDGLREALNLSLNTGDLEFVGHCCNIRSGVYTCSGLNLDEVNIKIDQDLKFLAKKWEYFAPNNVRTHMQFIRCISDPKNESGTVCGDIYSFEEMKDTHYEHKQFVQIHNHYASAYKMSYYLKDYDLAYENLMKADEAGAETALFVSYFTLFFKGLVTGEKYLSSPTEESKHLKEEVIKIADTFKLYADAAPINFKNKYELLHGVQLQMEGEFDKALASFEASIESSRESRFLHEEAIAWSKAASILQQLNRPTIAKKYIQAAYDCYKNWGAHAVCTRYKKLYPWLKVSDDISESMKPQGTSTNQALASMDLTSVLKSSEVLSGETDVKKLLKKLMLVAIENAGAEKGYMLLKIDDDLLVKAYGDVDQKTEYFENLHYDSFNKISKKVINFVNKTQQPIILSDSASDTRFEDDTYLKTNEIKSLFALPIINKRSLRGILYLENNLTTGAFTKERVELLNLLSGQIAISLENALLIENLEEKVRERTLEIEKEKETSDNLLLNILPKATATELKSTGKAEPKYYEKVSVMFLDFKNFSESSRNLDYKELVSQIDEYFKTFDAIIELYHVEKIKTIGDAYMCACGLPIERGDNAVLLTQAAIHLQKIISEFKDKRIAEGLPYFEAKIGIHTGPVVAGVVGSKKFAYDIWGDTVNIAARLETACEVGHITVSESTYGEIKHQISCVHRGKIPAKNMRDLDMYYVL